MKNSFSIFILNVIDGGIIRETVTEYNLTQLTEIAKRIVSNYLRQQGHLDEGNVEFKTEDGYAVILEVSNNPSESSVPLWTYAFDGATSVSLSLAAIRENTLKGQYRSTEIVALLKADLENRVCTAIADHCDNTYFGFTENSIVVDNLNGPTLAEYIIKIITED